MQGPPALRGGTDSFVNQLAVAPGADDGVVGRRVEGDDSSESGRTARPSRLPMNGPVAQRSWKNQTPTR